MTLIEGWIRKNVSAKRVDSSGLRYEQMDHQAPQDLGSVYRSYDLARFSDWPELTPIYAYLDALRTRGRILDVGTGDGWPALALAPHVAEVDDIDLSPRRIEVCRSNKERLNITNVDFVVGSAEEISFADNTFDGVVVGTAIEQMDDPQTALHELERVPVSEGE